MARVNSSVVIMPSGICLWCTQAETRQAHRAETVVCEKFQIALEKSGGDCHHRHIQSCAYARNVSGRTGTIETIGEQCCRHQRLTADVVVILNDPLLTCLTESKQQHHRDRQHQERQTALSTQQFLWNAPAEIQTVKMVIVRT